MSNDTATITCVIRAESPEKLRLAEQMAAEKVALDNIITDVIKAYPGGVETTRTERYRLGDYFDQIQILAGSSSQSFRLVFHRRADAKRFWRELIAEVLRSLRESTGISIGEITKSSQN